MGASMRRIMAAAGQKVPESKPAPRSNAAHAIVKYLDSVSDAEQFKELAQLLYDQASLAEGGQIANPADYVQRLQPACWSGSRAFPPRRRKPAANMRLQSRLRVIGAAALLVAVSGLTVGAKEKTAVNATELGITDVKTGTGPAIAAGQTAVVHYTGWLYSPTAHDHKGKKFDSSRDRNDPFSFRVGGGEVIGGWDQGVVGMQAGAANVSS